MIFSRKWRRSSKMWNKRGLAVITASAAILLLMLRQRPSFDTTTSLLLDYKKDYAPWCPSHNCDDTRHRNMPREAWATASTAADEAETESSHNQWVNVNTWLNPDTPFVMRIRDPIKDSFISRTIKLGNVWDEDIVSEMVQTIDKIKNEEYPVVVDVGGNIGYFTHVALALGATTITLEPMRENLGPMLSTIRANDGWQSRSTVYNNAVSFESTRVSMKSTSVTQNLSNGHVTQVQCATSDVKETSSSEHRYGVDYMETVTLDQVMLELHPEVERIHFMKIDVERFEVQVMSGAVRYLCNRIVEEIALEVAFLGLDGISTNNSRFDFLKSNSCQTDSMLRFLESIGYRIYFRGIEYTGRPLQEMPDNVFLIQQFTDLPPAERLKHTANNPCRDYVL